MSPHFPFDNPSLHANLSRVRARHVVPNGAGREAGFLALIIFPLLSVRCPKNTIYSTILPYFTIPSLHECLFPRVLAIFAKNQLKCLHRNQLRVKLAFFNQAQSCLIKVNQDVFSTRMPANPSLQYSTDSVLYSIFRSKTIRNLPGPSRIGHGTHRAQIRF
jgi:hypothetical protein